MSNVRIPFIHTYRAAFFVLFVVGFVLCALGGVSQAPSYGWTHPISVAGYLLGVVAVFLAVSVGLRRYAGPIADERAAFFALLGIIVAKFVLAALYPLFA